MRVLKIFKGSSFDDPYEPTDQDVLTAVSGTFKNPDKIMDDLLAGKFPEDRPLECAYSIIWTEPDSDVKGGMLRACLEENQMSPSTG